MANNTHEWLFVLLNKNKSDAAWWLKIQTIDELNLYLDTTNGRYGRAFQNYLQDSEYQPGQIGHGKHIREASLTQVAYYKALNQRKSIVDSLTSLASETAQYMANALVDTGYIYVNANGGWNNLKIRHQPGDFVRKKTLAWPNFTRADIKISRFPGGEHWYARIGPIDIRNPETDSLRFDDYETAMNTAKEYLFE